MRKSGLAAVLCAAAAIGTSAHAGTEEAREPYPLEILQQQDARLARIGYRLATGNAEFCPATVQSSGLLLHDASNYESPDAVRWLFNLKGDIGVQSVVPASPAEASGLTQNDTLIEIDGEPIALAFPPSDPTAQRTASIHDAIESRLAKGTVALSWIDGDGERRQGTLSGKPACESRFQLLYGTKWVGGGLGQVNVGNEFYGFELGDAEFAAPIAHEMAHNILRHREIFREVGKKRKLVRISERDADRLTPWLLFNAGYDPAAAIRFMSDWGPKLSGGGGIFRKRTHDGWDERVQFIEAEIRKIDQVVSDGGKADWRTHFESGLAAELTALRDRR